MGGIITSLIAIVLGGYLFVLVILFFFQSSLLYHPDKSAVNAVWSGLDEMQAVKARSADGIDLLSLYAVGQSNLPIVLYLHGNAGNIGSRGHKVRPFLDVGFGVLLVGYRGFGTNPGKPTEEGLYADAMAAYSLIDEESNRPIIIYGESLGTAVATNLAAKLASLCSPVSAVILEAPFPNLYSVAKYHYPFVPVQILLKDGFDQSSIIDKVQAPILVFHGGKDRTIPIRLGKSLFEKAIIPKKSKWFENAGHNNLFDFGAGELCIDFIQKAISRSTRIE